MQTGAGTIALIAAGVIIVAVGAYHVYKGGASRNFVDDLKGNSSDLVRRLGTVGYIAKGLVIAGAGVLVIVAASRSQPNKATGLDGALLGAQPWSRLTGGVNRFGRRFPRRSGKSEEGAYVRVEEGIACRAAARTDR
jgi:uncharacterized membrane protein